MQLWQKEKGWPVMKKVKVVQSEVMASSYKIVKVVQSDGHWPEVKWGFRYWQSSSLPSLAFRPTSNPSRMLRKINCKQIFESFPPKIHC